jgi:hypothetical protein
MSKGLDCDGRSRSARVQKFNGIKGAYYSPLLRYFKAIQGGREVPELINKIKEQRAVLRRGRDGGCDGGVDDGEALRYARARMTPAPLPVSYVTFDNFLRPLSPRISLSHASLVLLTFEVHYLLSCLFIFVSFSIFHPLSQ